jgi:hypothetical protein
MFAPLHHTGMVGTNASNALPTLGLLAAVTQLVRTAWQTPPVQLVQQTQQHASARRVLLALPASHALLAPTALEVTV